MEYENVNPKEEDDVEKYSPKEILRQLFPLVEGLEQPLKDRMNYSVE